AQQLGVAFNRARPHPLLPAAGRAGGEPQLDPLAKCDLVGDNVCTVVAALEQPAEFLAGVRQRAAKRLADALASDAVAQAPGIVPALIDATVTAIASFRHLALPNNKPRFARLAETHNIPTPARAPTPDDPLIPWPTGRPSTGSRAVPFLISAISFAHSTCAWRFVPMKECHFRLRLPVAGSRTS